MEQYLATWIQQQIASKHYADVVAGMVIRRPVVREGKRIFLPSSCGVIGANCGTGDWYDVVPDTTKRSIFFFEPVSGARPVKVEGMYTHFQATIRLIGWLNLPKLGLDPESCTGCGWGMKVMMDVLNLIPNNLFNLPTCHMVGIDIAIGNVLERGRGMWDRYTVDREKADYLNPTYFDYFAVDLSCSFRMANKCFGDIPENPPTC